MFSIHQIIWILIYISSLYSNASRPKLVPLKTPTSAYNISDYEAEVQSDKRKFLVLNNSAFIIESFALSHNFSYQCNWKYLPIDFEISIAKSKLIVTGYLDTAENEIYRYQILDICRTIRRYQIDKKQVIFIVGSEVKLVERKNAFYSIAWSLLKDFDIFTFWLFIFNIYDEENAKILYFQAFMYALVTYVGLKIMRKVFTKLHCMIRVQLAMIARYEAVNANTRMIEQFVAEDTNYSVAANVIQRRKKRN